MADTEFEEFRRTFESLPTSRKNYNITPFYSLIPGIDEFEDSPSPKSDLSDIEDIDGSSVVDDKEHNNSIITTNKNVDNHKDHNNIICNQVEDDEIGDGLKIIIGGCNRGMELIHENIEHNNDMQLERTSSVQSFNGERRRRKLPEIPKNKKSSILFLCGGPTSLAEEMSMTGQTQPLQQTQIYTTTSSNQNHQTNLHKSFLSLKCGYLLDEDYSPDSERMQSLGDVDSGHSTAHSPNDLKSMSPQLQSPTTTTTPQSNQNSSFPSPFGGVPFSQLEMLEATHRGLHKFIPRHHDEIEIEIGDPIYVQKEADDLWCEGVNIRSGRQGIFPSAYAVDLDYNDFDPTANQVKKERYLLGYLGSVETTAHKGTGVVCQAVRKIVGEYGDSPNGQACILEVSDQGLRMVDRSRPNMKKEKKPCIDYFYSLKNVSFCAFHPRDHRYIGFITKHPTVQRFACHVFKGNETTRPVAEAVGRAFQRFYQKFIETAYPIEDIYIE